MCSRFIILFLSAIVVLSGCQDVEKKRLTQLVTEWQGKEIRFPANPVFTTFAIDTVDYLIPLSEHKILVYIDSLGCTGCKLQLERWKLFIHEMDSMTNGTVPFLFFIHAKNYQKIRYLLKRDEFNYPVCIDTDDRLNKINLFPSEGTFQTFLLNKRNEVEIIGNPIHSPAVKKLYLKQITGRTTNSILLTTADVYPSEANLGVIKAGETKEAVFTLTNTGEQPLVIIDAATTCGCVSPAFEKHPANLGEKLNVTVRMQPKESGFFNETISVKCNTDKQIKLTIRGQAT